MFDETSRIISEAEKKREWRIKTLLCKSNCGRNKQNGSSRCKECSDKYKNENPQRLQHNG